MTVILPSSLVLRAKRHRALGLISMLVLLGGCGSAPPEHFYTLEPSAAITSAESRNTFSVSVGAVTLPEAVDRAQMVVRIGSNQVEQIEDRRWAESLRFAIPRVVGSNLSRYLPGAAVSGRSDAAVDGTIKYRVTIDILRFESRLADGITLEARWRIQGPGQIARTAAASFTETADANSYDELAAAHGRALARLSQNIAQALRDIEGGRP